jgi:peptidoglycan/LPS O-acetylase OafA/YrhL
LYSLADQLLATDDRPSGFDYLRLGLSISVISIHSVAICYGSDAFGEMWKGPFHPIAYFVVPSFFALSGFLVAGSLERNTVPAFLTLRFLRIFPALCVEVFISALFLGTLLTTLPLSSYFSHSEFWRYLGNVIGWVHFDLPGVFDNRVPPNHVNGSLWTVPYELDCYIAIAALAVVGAAKRPKIFAILVFLLALALTAKAALTTFFSIGGMHPGGVLVLSFLFGATMYLLRQRLPFSTALGLGSIAFSLALLYSGTTFYVATPFIAYATVYLGLQNPRRTVLIKGADYSYGMYLYGYPFQQVVATLIPFGMLWPINIGGAVLLSGCAAFLSWNLIEKQVLQRRKSALAFVGQVAGGLQQLVSGKFSGDRSATASK